MEKFCKIKHKNVKTRLISYATNINFLPAFLLNTNIFTIILEYQISKIKNTIKNGTLNNIFGIVLTKYIRTKIHIKF